MRFVLVDGRTPCQQSFCVLCCEPIRANYLRDVGTQLYYCDQKCYADYGKKAVMAVAARLFIDPAAMIGFDFREAQP
jgi:hypothetical protein